MTFQFFSGPLKIIHDPLVEDRRKNENVYFELRGHYNDHFHSTSDVVFSYRINIHVSFNVQYKNKNITILVLKPITAVIDPIPPYR